MRKNDPILNMHNKDEELLRSVGIDERQLKYLKEHNMLEEKVRSLIHDHISATITHGSTTLIL